MSSPQAPSPRWNSPRDTHEAGLLDSRHIEIHRPAPALNRWRIQRISLTAGGSPSASPCLSSASHPEFQRRRPRDITIHTRCPPPSPTRACPAQGLYSSNSPSSRFPPHPGSFWASLRASIVIACGSRHYRFSFLRWSFAWESPGCRAPRSASAGASPFGQGRPAWGQVRRSGSAGLSPFAQGPSAGSP